MSNSRQDKTKFRKLATEKEPTEQDVLKETESLKELIRLSVLVVSFLLFLLLLFWIFS